MTLQGVNLGGWLVLERWMTPSLFDGSDAHDEYAFMKTPDAAEKIDNHRRTFITEDDFRWLHEHHIDIVRIPIGFWVLDGYEQYTTCVEYLDKAMEWAETYNLQVIFDLHRVLGSADGHDLGGPRARPAWFDVAEYRDETIRTLEKLAFRYRDASHLWGIQLINEPRLSPKRYFILRRFYREAYKRLSLVARPGTRIILSDGFIPWLMRGIITRPLTKYPVVLDVHIYHFLPTDGWRSLKGHLRKARRHRRLIDWLQIVQPVMVGEWSAVISGRKMRHVPEAKQREFEPQYAAAQQRAYATAAANMYWNYKTEGRGVWNFRSLIEDGFIEVESV